MSTTVHYCDQSGCLRKVFRPHIYCNKHEDKNSTPPVEATQAKEPECAYHVDGIGGCTCPTPPPSEEDSLDKIFQEYRVFCEHSASDHCNHEVTEQEESAYRAEVKAAIEAWAAERIAEKKCGNCGVSMGGKISHMKQLKQRDSI